MKFFQRHPFLGSLIKLSAYIVVSWNVLLACFIGGVVVIGVLLLSGGASTEKLGQLEHIAGNGLSANQLLVIPVHGEIIGDADGDAAAGWSNSVTSGYDIKQKLYEAANHAEIKGVLLQINSPGGTIYGARAIADGVAHYRAQTKQPVYAHIEGVGASGAYWAAASTDRIIADYGSDIGSIGVIMGPFKYYDTVLSETGGLLDGGVITQNGIQSFSITAGTSKDVGNPYRRLTADEQHQLQLSVNNEYDQFVQYVSDHRKIPTDTLRNQIGAMIYDNKTAQNLKLIDQTASREDTYTALAKAAQLGDKDFQVMREVQPIGLVQSLLGAVGVKPQTSAKSSFDTCSLTRSKLAYYGSVTDLCAK
jgi:protease-4